MKIAAIGERGAKRDFIDLYFLLHIFTLKEVLRFYEKKYRLLASNFMHI